MNFYSTVFEHSYKITTYVLTCLKFSIGRYGNVAIFFLHRPLNSTISSEFFDISTSYKLSFTISRLCHPLMPQADRDHKSFNRRKKCAWRCLKTWIPMKFSTIADDILFKSNLRTKISARTTLSEDLKEEWARIRCRYVGDMEKNANWNSYIASSSILLKQSTKLRYYHLAFLNFICMSKYVNQSWLAYNGSFRNFVLISNCFEYH